MPTSFILASNNWRSNEVVAYEAMCNGPTFKDLPARQQDVALTGIVFKIGVISGCPVPIDGNHRKELAIEMKKFMLQNKSFADLTFEEVLTAFRFNAARTGDEKVKHYQNMFNLDYLGEVLSCYVKFKTEVKAKAEKELIRKNFFDIPDSPELPKLSDDQALEHSKERWTSEGDYMFIEARVYDILKKRGLINLNKEDRDRISKEASKKSDWIYKMDRDLYWLVSLEHVTSILSKKIAAAEYINGGYVKNDVVDGHQMTEADIRRNNEYLKGL